MAGKKNNNMKFSLDDTPPLVETIFCKQQTKMSGIVRGRDDSGHKVYRRLSPFVFSHRYTYLSLYGVSVKLAEIIIIIIF